MHGFFENHTDAQSTCFIRCAALTDTSKHQLLSGTRPAFCVQEFLGVSEAMVESGKCTRSFRYLIA